MMTQEILDAVLTTTEKEGLDESLISKFREQYKGIHFTYCMDDDVHYPKAYAERAGFNAYLVDSRDHCSKLTTDVSIASGVVLAEVFDD